MPFLHIPALGNTREHPRLGTPTFAGIAMSEAPAAVVEFFRTTGALKAQLTAAEASAAIVAEVAALTGVVADAIAKTEAPIAEIGKLIDEAAKLAAMPILGTERATIEGFSAIVTTAMQAAAIPDGTASPVAYLKSVLPLAHGLDKKVIENALADFDRALVAHETATARLKAAHTRLLELAVQADDGPARDKVARLKASIDFKRRLPQALDSLAAGREQMAAALAQIDLVINTLKECAA